MGGAVTKQKTRNLSKILAPFGKQIEFEEVILDNDVTLLRLRIKEGSRFTVIDLDPVTAEAWQTIMANWLEKVSISEDKGKTP